MLKTFVTLFFLFVYSLGVHAQNHSAIKVSGSLTDDQNKPVDYASVSLVRVSDSTVVKGTLSNETGLYVFENINPGNYLVKVTSVGYTKASSQPFYVADGAPAIVVPVLIMHQGSHSLQTVTITASKPLIEHQADRVVMNVENSILAAGNSAMDILERAPGVSIDKDDNISLKGKQGVTVMVNDKLTYLSADQLATLLRSTDGNTIQSIEIITSPSAKYDAAGNSGIINIKLKQNKQSGTSGSVSVSAGVAKGVKLMDDNTINLNHKEGNLNVFGTFSHSDPSRVSDISLDRIINNNSNGLTYFDQQSHPQSYSHNNAYRLGADYETSHENTVGFSVSGYDNSSNVNNNNNTKIQSTPAGIPDSLVNTKSDQRNTNKNLAININDKLKLDTNGQELSADLDYVKYNNNTFTQYTNDFFFSDGDTQHPQQVLTNRTPSNIDIRTAKIDYVKPLDKTTKLEAGVKYSNVKTDNNLQVQVLNNGNFINDTTQSNHFIYTEKITAGYLNLNKQMDNTSVQLGLRSEYTQSNGNLIGRNTVNRDYINFFPNVFINHTLDSKNELSLSYSRRIDRPGYADLNPFTYFLDPYTFIQGNPFLNPQNTDNYQASYTYNKTINVSLGYSHTSNVITFVVLTSGDKTFDTGRNLNAYNVYNMDFNTPYTITKWWSGNVDFNGFYQQYKADTLAGSRVNKSNVAFEVKATETFLFYNFKGELTGNYNSANIEGVSAIKPYYGVDAGVSRSFDHKKLNMKLSVSDIFDTRRFGVSSQEFSNFIFSQRSNTRVARLTATYNFGNSKVKAITHTSGADDEAGRVKTN
ncbi:TonB-dependent receptor domain-containing protein [Mucilaginibacter sp. X4EP1]|uniref:outer membrane beta-barrel family protein n=1 Tax=Mucilaginibacter sp. X4EP1 TaxID=2723092 RepID=UPI002167CBEE|nr:outer membrane beta-barrel family protein [Mucilaginibacter sp. X4EP1]MCS3812701.1 outer membrane receptor protein involved in Fe transport [Mucilaginibacter sp. X4EP1]